MTTHANLFTVCDAAFESTRTIRVANKLARLSVVSDLVVNFRTGQTARLGARTNRYCFDRRYRHHRLREQTVELQVPRRVRTQPRHNAARRDFEDSAERVATLTRLVDQSDHL